MRDWPAVALAERVAETGCPAAPVGMGLAQAPVVVAVAVAGLVWVRGSVTLESQEGLAVPVTVVLRVARDITVTPCRLLSITPAAEAGLEVMAVELQ